MQNILLRTLTIALAWLLLAPAAFTAAPAKGTEQNPFVGKGPLGKWVKNDKWAMRATKVVTIDNMEKFAALPWTKRLTEKKKERIFKHAGAMFREEGKLLLVTLEAKNLNPGKYDIGVTYPSWCVRTDDGQQGDNGDVVDNGRMVHGGQQEIMADLAFCLKGGFPQCEKLNPGAKTGGIIPFFIPVYAEAKLLWFLSNNRYGKDESLVISLAAK